MMERTKEKDGTGRMLEGKRRVPKVVKCGVNENKSLSDVECGLGTGEEKYGYL